MIKQPPAVSHVFCMIFILLVSGEDCFNIQPFGQKSGFKECRILHYIGNLKPFIERDFISIMTPYKMILLCIGTRVTDTWRLSQGFVSICFLIKYIHVRRKLDENCITC